MSGSLRRKTRFNTYGLILVQILNPAKITFVIQSFSLTSKFLR